MDFLGGSDVLSDESAVAGGCQSKKVDPVEARTPGGTCIPKHRWPTQSHEFPTDQLIFQGASTGYCTDLGL